MSFIHVKLNVSDLQIETPICFSYLAWSNLEQHQNPQWSPESPSPQLQSGMSPGLKYGSIHEWRKRHNESQHISH